MKTLAKYNPCTGSVQTEEVFIHELQERERRSSP
jgi:hypothetical protein